MLAGQRFHQLYCLIQPACSPHLLIPQEGSRGKLGSFTTCMASSTLKLSFLFQQRALHRLREGIGKTLLKRQNGGGKGSGGGGGWREAQKGAGGQNTACVSCVTNHERDHRKGKNYNQIERKLKTLTMSRQHVCGVACPSHCNRQQTKQGSRH